MANTIEKAYAHSVRDVAEALETDLATGLTERAVHERRTRYGPNRLRRQTKKSALKILLHQFDSFIVWLLAAAATLSFLLGDIPEGLAIVVVLTINGAIGFFTELRAARSMEALLNIAEVVTRVRRDGTERMVDARDLVPGDVVVFEAGDVVTADLRIAEASNLRCDESILTGESAPVTKEVSAVRPDAAIGDRSSMVFKGTAIIQGAGAGFVVTTGMRTELGRITELAQSAEGGPPPLQRRLERLGRRLVWLTVGLAVLTMGLGILRGHALVDMIQTGIALAVAAVPEGLPVVATLCLARGMWRMAQRNALITRLSSVETLGSTTIILTDKTGTLTENRMTVSRYLLPGRDLDTRHDADRFFFSADRVDVSPADDTQLTRALQIGALCNNATLGDNGEPSGDPMEIALLAAAKGHGALYLHAAGPHEQVQEHAFEPRGKMMATVHASPEGYLFAIKGAPEAVIAASTTELGPDGPRPLDAQGRANWARRSRETASKGLRLLALAMKIEQSPDVAPYEGLTLVGLVCLHDPIRADVADAIRASNGAGVRVVMMTGDHADTAEAIARDAGLGDGDLKVIHGQELEGVDAREADPALRARVLEADVFARVSPATKLTLVAMYQRAGHVVAMTGDGVNDAPALKQADIGIAMGRRGTQVARDAAHMVLKDDAFDTIIEAMRQGRVIFTNIRKFVVYLMSCNVSELLVVGLAIGFGLPSPLLPLQILFLNLVTDVFPAFALGLGRGDGTVMNRPPRDPAEPIVTGRHWAFIGLLGAAITLATLGAFALALYWLRLDEMSAVTVAFLTLALAQIWNVFNLRGPDGGPLRNDVTRNLYVWGAIAVCLGLVASALWLPGLSAVLGLPDPGTSGLLLAGAMSLPPLILGQFLVGSRSPE